MATYTELQTDVIDTIKDSQVDATRAQAFIKIAERKLERDLLSGGSAPRQMMARLDTTTDANSLITLPLDFHKVRAVKISGMGARYAAPSLVESQASGFASADVVLDYYQKIPALSGVITTNWLLEAGYDLYLWGACLQYVPWGHEEDVLGLWSTFYQDALRTVKDVHGPQPRGALRSSKDAQAGALYTLVGPSMLFGQR